MTARTAPLPWYGGKARLAPHIVPLLPRHTVYCEPFGGAASVLFSKPRVPLEVYNDIHSGLVNFFRMLRDRPEDLTRVLALTPYARSEYAQACETWREQTDDLERARLWYVAAWQSFGSTPGSGWAYQRDARDRESPNKTGRVRARSFVSAVDALPMFAERLRGVQVDCRPWPEVLDLYEREDSLFYVDPPYHPETRKGGGEYEHELDAAGHEALVARLQTLVGSVLVSGYDHGTYRELEVQGFRRIEIPHYKMASTRKGKPRDKVTEVLWLRVAESSIRQMSFA